MEELGTAAEKQFSFVNDLVASVSGDYGMLVKLVGTLSFTVPEDVTSVVIYVAQYKDYTTKVNVNGTEYTVATASNNGEYTAITIDTTTTKTVSLETVSAALTSFGNVKNIPIIAHIKMIAICFGDAEMLRSFL